jgi:hypothetical protein
MSSLFRRMPLFFSFQPRFSVVSRAMYTSGTTPSFPYFLCPKGLSLLLPVHVLSREVSFIIRQRQAKEQSNLRGEVVGD